MVKMHDDVDQIEGERKTNGHTRARAAPRVPSFVRSTSERHDVRAPDFMRARSGGGAATSIRTPPSKTAASPSPRNATPTRDGAANERSRAVEQAEPTPSASQTPQASSNTPTTTTPAPMTQPSAPAQSSENALNANERAEGVKATASPPPSAVKGAAPDKTPTTAKDVAPSEDAHAFDRLRDAVLMLRHASASLAEQARSDALEIGIEIARQIVRQELTTSVEPMMRFVKEAIRQAGDARVVRVRLSPEDARRLGGHLSEFRTSALSASQVEIIEDDTLTRGDVEIDTDFGRIDARVSRRLDELQRTVEETWQKTRPTTGTE